MSTSLIVLIPVILLGIVGLFCFVGCIFEPYEVAPPFTAYTGKIALPTGAIIAYWPLKETKDTDPAVDLISSNNGNYIDQNTVEVGTIYPWRSIVSRTAPIPTCCQPPPRGISRWGSQRSWRATSICCRTILCPPAAWW
jgi:hypothetical protein